MQYYYLVHNSLLRNKSTSFLRINSKSLDLSFDELGYLNYKEPIPLLVRGEGQEVNLYFPSYEKSLSFIDLMTPALKEVFERFKMPNHRWFAAEAGYDLDFIDSVRKNFKVQYNIDLNEKRDYLVLQILNKRREELAFDQMEFNVVNFRDRKSVLRPFDGKINSMEEFNRLGKEIYLKTKRNDIIEDIDSPVYVYRKNYDILWGGTQIVFNEKVKAALEATQIITPQNGLEFVEFTEYKIEMLGENG
jgi:hypothetical protein